MFQLGQLLALASQRRFGEMHARASELRGEAPSFWAAVSAGLHGEAEAMAGEGVLSAAEQRMILAVSRGEAILPEDWEAIEAAMDFEMDRRLLASLLRGLSGAVR